MCIRKASSRRRVRRVDSVVPGEQPQPADQDGPQNSSLPNLTWPALLAQWTRFAQASVGLPRTREGDRWRRAVPAIIGLQAVTFAIRDLHVLPSDEQAFGLDKARVLTRRHGEELIALFGEEPLHPEVAALISDAYSELALASERFARDRKN